MRRHLGYTYQEWRDLPWHWQRAYFEELVDEFTQEEDASADAGDPLSIDLASGDVDPATLGFSVG